MATVYSLICWGGSSGKSVTISTANKVTLTNHGLRDGTGVQFTSGSSLPSPLALNTTYYAKYDTSSTFLLYSDAALTTQITFGTGGTSLIMKSLYFLTGVPDYTRYGGATTTDPTGARIYESIPTFQATRGPATTGFDTEVCEIGMSFEDYYGINFNFSMPAAPRVIYTSMIAGVRSGAFHNGVLGSGYLFKPNQTGASGNNITIEGISASCISAGGNILTVGGLNCIVENCILLHPSAATGGRCIQVYGSNLRITNNICVGANIGIEDYAGAQSYIANNTVVKNNNGIMSYSDTTTSRYGYWYNNLVVGNTRNWGPTPTSLEGAAHNAGETGDTYTPWGTNDVVVATTDLVNFGASTWAATDDYTPVATTSPQVEAGTTYYGQPVSDMLGNTVPAYPGAGNGDGVPDVGCFEKDLGYGAWPTTDYYGLAFTGLLSGMFVKVFATGTDTERFSTTNSGTSETWSVNSSGTDTVDYVIMKAGYEPIRVTGVVVNGGPDGIQSVPITPVIARWYQASSGLIIDTNAFANASTKKFGLTAASTLQNFASYLLEQWIALGDSGEAYANQPFPIAANGPNSFSWLYGWEADLTTYSATITNLSRDGMRYLDTGGTATASWCAILSVNAETGTQLRYQQTDGGTTVDADNTGNMDQLVQIYGDATHGNFDYTGHLVIKAQSQGYDQTEVDVVNLYGTLEDQLYVVGMTQLANGVAAGNPTISDITITDHGTSPVTWNAKSITITDAGTTTGEDILKAIRYAQETGGTFQGKDAFNWHDLIQVNGSSYKGVRGAIYGDTGATLKGVRILRGTDAHPDFTLHTADDGTTVSTTPPAQATATVLANSRIQLYNVTTATELDNDFLTGTSYANTLTSGVSVGDTLRLRVDKLGYEEAVVTALWTTTGASFLVTQMADAVYTNNGIDGSAVTNITADVGTATVQINEDGGSKTWPMIYAYINYWRTTATGVAAANFMSATDTANYFLDAWKVRNTNANPLQLTGGWGRELTAGTVAACIDAAGSTGNIYAEPDHVVAYQTTGTYAITGDISTVLAAIPSASSNAAATLAAATAAGGIDSNIKKVNDVTVTGTGTGLDPWNPV